MFKILLLLSVKVWVLYSLFWSKETVDPSIFHLFLGLPMPLFPRILHSIAILGRRPAGIRSALQLLLATCPAHLVEDEMSGTCSAYGVDKKCVQNFCCNPEGKRPLGIPGCRRDNI
jgi:hypothetical protein